MSLSILLLYNFILNIFVCVKKSFKFYPFVNASFVNLW